MTLKARFLHLLLLVLLTHDEARAKLRLPIFLRGGDFSRQPDLGLHPLAKTSLHIRAARLSPGDSCWGEPGGGGGADPGVEMIKLRFFVRANRVP